MAPLIFVSYSHKDEDWKDRLVKHISVAGRQDLLEEWDDRRIRAGENWRQMIEEALSRAKIAVLLVSVDFLLSDFIQTEEVKMILGRRQTEGLQVIPVIAKHCLWPHVPWLAPLTARPTDGTPLFGMPAPQQEEALVAIADEIVKMLEVSTRELPVPEPQTLSGLGKPEQQLEAGAAGPPPDQGHQFEAELARATRLPGRREYELLEERWHHSLERQPISIDRLLRQSVALLEQSSGYPWSLRVLREAGFDDHGLSRLRRLGLLRLAPSRGTVEFAQTRFLSWAVATGLLAAWRAGELDDDSLIQHGLACLAAVTNPGQPWLGEAVLDLLWQLAGDGGNLQTTAALLAALENHHPGETVVSSAWQLGSRLLPAIFDRLRVHAASENSWSIR